MSDDSAHGAQRIRAAIAAAASAGRPAVAAFLTAGFPTREAFPSIATSVARAADVLEIGVPFSDPMADGVTIQRTSRIAVENGTSLEWILRTLQGVMAEAPVVLMSYLNPIVAFGVHRFARAAAGAGVSGVIVPDMPLEESARAREALDDAGVALVQLVTPVTPPARRREVCANSRGFVYAVASLGTTGGATALNDDAFAYLDAVREESPWPVLAGFGLRTTEHLQRIASHVDGVIVGSALLECIERGDDPCAFLSAWTTQERS